MTTYPYRKRKMINGKMRSFYGKTKKEVERKMIEALVESTKDRPEVLGGDMLLKDWIPRCIEIYKVNQSDITRRKYMDRVNYNITSKIGDMKLKDIQPFHCQMILTPLVNKSQRHINEIYQALRFIFKHAYSNGFIAKDPTANLTKPIGYKHIGSALSPAERKAVVEVAKQKRIYYVFLLMMECGCRPFEAYNCKRNDITNKDNLHFLHIRGTKNKNADRLVPMPDYVYDLVADLPKDDYISSSKNGTNLYSSSRNTIWLHFKKDLYDYMDTIGMSSRNTDIINNKDNLVSYSLRHEYITNLVRKGVHPKMISMLAGHADVKITMSIYSNLTQNDVYNTAVLLKKLEAESACASMMQNG
ncbi:MAG: tyrosine-type recombinase/integrase [Clostridia bacterium]|nr:tyrosine-type recombinase/integrase [Clostridia bacterium]